MAEGKSAEELASPNAAAAASEKKAASAKRSTKAPAAVASPPAAEKAEVERGAFGGRGHLPADPVIQYCSHATKNGLL